MKTANAKMVWSYWKNNRSPDFVHWFENEIYGEESSIADIDRDLSEEDRNAGSKLNTRR
jgi:hypothetical protein